MYLVLTRERMRMTPRVTLILKRAFSPLAERIATTWRREFRERERERESTQAHDMVTGVTEQTRKQHDLVTGVTEQTRNQRDIITGVHEEVMYCSPSTSSGKQKKNRSTSQPNFAAKTPLRHLRQTKFCWHFSS